MEVTLGWMEKSRERDTAVTLAERTERGLHGETCRIFFSFYCFKQKRGSFIHQAWLMLLSKTHTVFASQLEESIVERCLTSPAQPATEQNASISVELVQWQI